MIQKMPRCQMVPILCTQAARLEILAGVRHHLPHPANAASGSVVKQNVAIETCGKEYAALRC